MSGSRNSFNSPTGVQEPNRLRSPSGSSGGCQAYTESGAQCKESRSLKIIDEIQHLYEDRLRRIDDEAGGDGTQLKLKTLTAWVNDLGEQNTMLVQTVEQLEREASDRVALLEEQLQRSSRTALGYMTKLQDYDHQMNEATGEKIQSESTSLKISSKLAMAQQTEEALRARVCSLQSDIGSLLELIRRARQDGCWETDGLNFCEVTFEDIFGSSSPYQVCTNIPTIQDQDGKAPKTIRVCVEIIEPQALFSDDLNPNPFSFYWTYEPPPVQPWDDSSSYFDMFEV